MPIALLAGLLGAPFAPAQTGKHGALSDGDLFNDPHFHLTNYVQQGTDIHKHLEIMGDKVGRSTLFGIPLQQTWSHENSGDFAPTYHLQSDAPLYYYSFTDAYIARLYQSLSKAQQARLDPMITGFNPADMYAVEHIRRVLELFPGVFTGIGEFTIHKEFVSSKVAGDTASLTDPAVARILDFAAEVGLLVILHSDIDMPFAKAGAAERNPEHPSIIEAIIADPKMRHVYFGISWDEVAKYAIATPQAVKLTAGMLNRHPHRFLFGTDNVAPADQATQLRVLHVEAATRSLPFGPIGGE